MRNYVAGRLSRAYGRAAALRLCRVYLEPARWAALKRLCFHDLEGDGETRSEA